MRIEDVIFSASSLRACCFKAREGSLLRSRTRYLDARSAHLKGDSFVVPGTSARPPGDAFESKSPGWMVDRKDRKMGDVMDILIDDGLRAREFVAGLRHNLLVPSDTMAILSKEAKKDFMRRIPDVSSSYGGDAYTVVSVPATSVSRVTPDPLFYKVVTKVSLDDLTNSILRALRAGRSEKGLVRALFADLTQQSG